MLRVSGLAPEKGRGLRVRGSMGSPLVHKASEAQPDAMEALYESGITPDILKGRLRQKLGIGTAYSNLSQVPETFRSQGLHLLPFLFSADGAGAGSRAFGVVAHIMRRLNMALRVISSRSGAQ